MFRVLEEEGILPTPLADEMVEMAGVRNVLAHEYATIDTDRVHHHLQDIEQFREFAKTVDDFIG